MQGFCVIRQFQTNLITIWLLHDEDIYCDLVWFLCLGALMENPHH